MEKTVIRVNGTGNAWPVLLGREHPFYNKQNYEELANVSFSIIKTRALPITSESIVWEILIDAGHGIVQYLIRQQNRLPDAIVLTHSHLDHTLSLDWIIQSYYKHHRKGRKLPLYSGSAGWDFVSRSFPHLPDITDFREMKPGQALLIEEAAGVKLTPFPVYHGEHAPGPNMLVFENLDGERMGDKVIFSGDILCPLLRRADYRYLQGARFAFLDANNRFPYTRSNHWSIISQGPDGRPESKYLGEFRNRLSMSQLIASHLPVRRDGLVHDYFDELMAYREDPMPLSIFEFLKKVSIDQVLLIHHGGIEDTDHNEQELLNPVQLENWTGARGELAGINSSFTVPLPGDIFELNSI